MEIKVTLQPNETPEQAEELFVKAITEKYNVEKEPHPDPVVNELVYKMVQEYNKQLVGMIDEIFQVIKNGKEVVGKSWEFQKGKALPEGTVRVWDGYEYVKQGKEWKPTGKKKSSEPEVEKKEKTTETKETSKEKDTEQGIHSFDKKIWYHSTPSENVESIKKEGFRPSQNSMFGSGVYLAESPAYSDSKMSHLPIQAKVTKTLEVRSIDFPEQYQKVTGKKYSGVGGMEKDLQEYGYDSVYITDDKWLLVFDPKNLEVIDRPSAPSVDVDPQQVEKDTKEIITDEEKEKDEIISSLKKYIGEFKKDGNEKLEEDLSQVLDSFMKDQWDQGFGILKHSQLKYDLPQTYTRVQKYINREILRKKGILEWGEKPGKYTIYRSGELKDNPRGLYFSPDFEGAQPYGENVQTYEVTIQKPFVVKNQKEAIEKLGGKYPIQSGDEVEWGRKVDRLLVSLVKKTDYDSVVLTDPAPPALKEMMLINGKSVKEKIKKSKEQDLDPTEEQIEEFKKRTKEHIDRVRKNLNYLGTVTDLDKKKLDEIGKNHDHTKFEPDMIKPYSFINEYYKQLRQGKKVERPKVVDSATEYHVTTETHHPEAHKDLNKMSDYDLAEMVSDWQAMSQELGEGSCRGWADKHVGTRWKFSDEVKKKIYQFIEKFEGDSNGKDN